VQFAGALYVGDEASKGREPVLRDVLLCVASLVPGTPTRAHDEVWVTLRGRAPQDVRRVGRAPTARRVNMVEERVRALARAHNLFTLAETLEELPAAADVWPYNGAGAYRRTRGRDTLAGTCPQCEHFYVVYGVGESDGAELTPCECLVKD
jgi:hypothetical protein